MTHIKPASETLLRHIGAFEKSRRIAMRELSRQGLYPNDEARHTLFSPVYMATIKPNRRPPEFEAVVA